MIKNILSFRFHLIVKFIILLLITPACKKSIKISDFDKAHAEWRTKRLERLKSENGWLNLVGLYWLKDGQNSFGSDSSNNLVFPPNAPAFAGIIQKNDTMISLQVKEGIEIMVEGKPVTQMDLLSDATRNPTKVTMGSLVFFIIKRDNQYGIRLRDLQAPLLSKVDSIPCYLPDTAYLVKAHFIPFEQPLMLKVATVIGTSEDYKVPGRLEFTLHGKECTLLPSEEGEGYFIIFADETSARETYGPGRFLTCPKPDKDNMVIIDFNRAYNPPCAFTPYATCPLPPRENLLDVKVEAGEKDVHIYEH